jgi:hypothetical protein
LRTITHRQFRPTLARPPQSIIIQCTHALGYSLVLIKIIAVQPTQNQDYLAHQNGNQKAIQD